MAHGVQWSCSLYHIVCIFAPGIPVTLIFDLTIPE